MELSSEESTIYISDASLEQLLISSDSDDHSDHPIQPTTSDHSDHGGNLKQPSSPDRSDHSDHRHWPASPRSRSITPVPPPTHDGFPITISDNSSISPWSNRSLSPIEFSSDWSCCKSPQFPDGLQFIPPSPIDLDEPQSFSPTYPYGPLPDHYFSYSPPYPYSSPPAQPDEPAHQIPVHVRDETRPIGFQNIPVIIRPRNQGKDQN